MHDQANFLRQLVKKDQQPKYNRPPDTPRMVAVLGGKRNVGASTVALNLAVALAQTGQRLLLIDGDLHHAKLHRMCGLTEGDSLLDVSQGTRTVHEALQPAQGGIQILPGHRLTGEVTECSVEAQERLIGQVRGLGRFVETVIFDLGSELAPSVRRFTEIMDLLLLVTTSDPVSIMDTYAAIKVLLMPDHPRWVGTLINKIKSEEETKEVYQRLSVCCRRFLGRELHCIGGLPFDKAIPLSLAEQQSVVLSHQTARVSQVLQQIASELIQASEWQNFNLPLHFNNSDRTTQLRPILKPIIRSM